MGKSYRAMISSDWSECLAPSGPFDCIRFTCPELTDALAEVFRKYTGNQMSLGEASAKIKSLLPQEISPAQMDAYLDAEFDTYKNVAELILWCQSHDILFMINSTGMIGYFQRVFAKALLPSIPVLSAHPLIRYPAGQSDPGHVLELFETPDKGRNTSAVAKTLGIRPDRIILMGDSGGDGPHFEWGARTGATLVGSMTKASLDGYCRRKHIKIHHRHGIDFSKNATPGMDVDFMDLCDFIADIFGL
jgi:2-hydroxy-3-keto-5-methylthiopentenyl-1-phosphate phosphatase